MATELQVEVPSELMIEPRSGYLLVTLTGSVSLARMKVVQQEIQTRAAACGMTRILVDARKKLRLPDIHQRFELAHWLSHHWSTQLKLAIVSSIPIGERDYLTEAVMINHHHTVRTFNTEEEAAHWLMADTVRV